jgi:FtsP/CotA-like multicopper oxidase with cupredoxin domain
VAYSNADDGSENLVDPGCTHVYTISAVAAGVWPFHSHRDSRDELARGLYGAVIVPDAGEAPATHEFVSFLGQLGIESETAAPATDEEGGGAASHFYMTINGRPGTTSHPRLIELNNGEYQPSEGEAHAKVGDQVRWRVLNVSPDDEHTFHLHGHRWGNPAIDDVALAPAQGTSLEFVEDAPGRWMYHCHVLDHVNDGMFAFYNVDP